MPISICLDWDEDRTISHQRADLTEIGSQGVVSEILTGKRELNIRQVRALSERFGVSTATFV